MLALQNRMDEPRVTRAGAGIPGPPTGETTTNLLARVRSGDHGALELLFARFAPPLRRWAAGRMPRFARDVADTDDLVQETLLSTFRRITSFSPAHPGALQAYLREALMNRIRDELRRWKRRPGEETLDEQIPDASASPLEHTIGRAAVDRYERALARLRPDDREAIIARVEMGYSYQELADALGKRSADAARKAAERALLRLADEMNRDH